MIQKKLLLTGLLLLSMLLSLNAAYAEESKWIDIDLSEVNEAFEDQRRKDIMTSLCFTLGLLCVTGSAFLIVKSRKDID